MSPERRQKLEKLFHSAQEYDGDARAAFLVKACEGDGELLRELETILAHHQQAKSFMESPAYAVEAESIVADDSSLGLIGKTVASYQVLSQLGTGGMGEVYLAFDKVLERKVALKFLRGELTGDMHRLRRFRQEARAASALNHPNILTVFEIGEIEGRQFIATEFVGGRTLREVMNLGPLELAQVFEIAVQIASALLAAHGAGIVHRDIKPENVMVRHDGLVKLLDFGLAKRFTSLAANAEESTKALVRTESGIVVGTVFYMSPEQIRGLAVDERSDIWSLGIVLYELLAGEKPFNGITTSDVIASVLTTKPRSVTQYRNDVPAELSQIITKILRKESAHRYQTVAEVLNDLKSIKHELEFRSESERYSRQPLSNCEPSVGTEGRARVYTNSAASTVTETERNRQLTFGDFRLDETNECLWHHARMIALRPKAYAVLKYLVEHAGVLVTKRQLLEAVWREMFVGNAVLKDSIRQLRDALGDEAKSPQFIETAHSRGYRFIARVVEQPNTYPTLSIQPSAANVQSSSSLPLSVLGREAALASLHSWLAKAIVAESQTIFITGEPGIGKTTLLEAFLEQSMVLHDLWIARGQCLEQYGASEAYLPVLEAFSRLGQGKGRARIVESLRSRAPTWLFQMPGLTTESDRKLLQQRAVRTTRESMLREMADAIEALTTKLPLILVLEDLHWSDYSTLDLVSYLGRRCHSARLMLIGTYRPVEMTEHPLKGVKQELQIHGLCKELPLEYLTKDSVAEFLDSRFRNHQFPLRLAEMIHKHTEGNPLFMVNVVDYLISEKIIAEREGNWQLQVKLDEVELGVPENIRHLIEKQIERLSEAEQRVLEGASIVGMDCSSVAMSAGLNEDIVKIEEVCDELARNSRFLLPAYLAKLPDGTITPRYRFIHALYLDVIYSRIAATRRSQIHRRIAECGERIYGDRVGEIAAELAVHFEQARDWTRAVKYLQIAAENAARRSANHEAMVLAQRRLELLRTLARTSENVAQESS